MYILHIRAWQTLGTTYFRVCCLVTKLCLTCLWPRGLHPARLLWPWDLPGKNTRVGCHFFLLEIFLTQGSSTCLLHWQVDSSPLGHLRSPLQGTRIMERKREKETTLKMKETVRLRFFFLISRDDLFINLFLKLIYLAALGFSSGTKGLWSSLLYAGSSPLTRDRTQDPRIGLMES